MARAVRSAPCEGCPYRRDVPSGLWHPDEYEALRAYDRPTGDQPIAGFACHASPNDYCHGWAAVHSRRGHEHELLALRLWPPATWPTVRIPLFASGSEAADHGLADVYEPGPEARALVQRLLAKHDHLRSDP